MKNILLLFASKINPISDEATGTSKFRITKYNLSDKGQELVETLQTNESAVRFLSKKLPSGKFDSIFGFASKGALKPVIVNAGPFQEFWGKSSVEILQERVNDCYEEYKSWPYNEDNPLAASMKEMTDMSEQIISYKEKTGDDVTIYADMTGGMRNASMMMLGIMRFLEYSGIVLGDIVYSDFDKHRVESAKDIYLFFDMVAGAKEFKNFGSIKELHIYFDNLPAAEKSAKLTTLLKAMNDFSDQIKLCYYYDFKNAIKGLEKAVKEFDTSRDDNNHDKLLRSMLPTIQSAYESIFSNELKQADDLDYIEWCVKHGYYQQAMTLYVERVPKFVDDHNIMKFNDKQPELVDNYNNALKDDKFLRKNYYIMSYSFGSEKSDFLNSQKLTDVITELIHNIIGRMWHNNGYDEILENIEKLREKNTCRYEFRFDIYKIIETMKILLLARDYDKKTFSELLYSNEILGKLFVFFSVNYLKSFGKKSELLRKKVALENFAQMTFDDFCCIYFPNKPLRIRDFLKYCEGSISYNKENLLAQALGIVIETKLEQAVLKKIDEMQNCIDAGWILCDKTRKACLVQIAGDYKQIQCMRNFTNHAHNEKSKYSTEQIKSYILAGIEHLREEVRYVGGQ